MAAANVCLSYDISPDSPKLAVIFNHSRFENGLSELPGNNVDTLRIVATLDNLGFKSLVFSNICAQDIFQITSNGRSLNFSLITVLFYV